MKERHLTIIEASKIKNRMTKYKDRRCVIECKDCPLCIGNNNTCCTCGDLMGRYPEKYERILIKWDEEHPIKTRAMDFFEKFPNAPKEDRGTPIFCTLCCGYCDKCDNTNCEECWNTPLEDGEQE